MPDVFSKGLQAWDICEGWKVNDLQPVQTPPDNYRENKK